MTSGVLISVYAGRTSASGYSGNPRTSEKSFDRISGIDSSRLVKTDRNFLRPPDRADLVKIARDGLEEHRIARRANAILLLDRGMKFEEVASVLFVDDSTIRAWLKVFDEGGVEELVLFDLKGGTGALSPLQIDELRAWAMEVPPASTVEGNACLIVGATGLIPEKSFAPCVIAGATTLFLFSGVDI